MKQVNRVKHVNEVKQVHLMNQVDQMHQLQHVNQLHQWIITFIRFVDASYQENYSPTAALKDE